MVEGLGDEVEGDSAVLDAGAGAFVEPDEGAAGVDSELLDFDHLFAVDLAQGATEHGAVLAEDADFAAVDGAPTRDDAVASGALGKHAEGVGAVAC